MDRLPSDIDPLSGPPPGIVAPNSSLLESSTSTPNRPVPLSDSPNLRSSAPGVGTQSTSVGSLTSHTPGQHLGQPQSGGPSPRMNSSMASNSMPQTSVQTTQTLSAPIANGSSRSSQDQGHQSQTASAQIPQSESSLSTQQPQSTATTHQRNQTTSNQQPTPQQEASQSGGNTSLRDSRAKQQSARRCAINFLKIYYRTLSANSKDLLRYYDLNACVDRISYTEFQNDDATGISLQSVRNLLRDFGSVNRVTIKLIDYQYSSVDNVLISVHGCMQFAEAINPSKTSSLSAGSPARSLPPNTDVDFLQIFYLTKNTKGWWVIQNDIFRFMADAVERIPVQQNFGSMRQSMETMTHNAHGGMNDPGRFNGGSSPVPNSTHGFSQNLHSSGAGKPLSRSQEMGAAAIVPPGRGQQSSQQLRSSEGLAQFSGSPVPHCQTPTYSHILQTRNGKKTPDDFDSSMDPDTVLESNFSNDKSQYHRPTMGGAPLVTNGDVSGISTNRLNRGPRVSHGLNVSTQQTARSNPVGAQVMSGPPPNAVGGNPPSSSRAGRRGSGGSMTFPYPSGPQHARQTHSRPVSSHGPNSYPRSNSQYEGSSDFRGRPRSGPQYFGGGRGRNSRSQENGIFVKMNCDLTEMDIRNACSEFGEIDSVEVRPEKRFAFVFFISGESVMKAVNAGRFTCCKTDHYIQKKKPYNSSQHNQRFNGESVHSGTRRGNRSVRGNFDSRPSSKSRSSRGSDKLHNRENRDPRHGDKNTRGETDRSLKRGKPRSLVSGTHSTQPAESNSSTHASSPKKPKKKKNQSARGRNGEEQTFLDSTDAGQKENVNSENVKVLEHEVGAHPKEVEQ